MVLATQSNITMANVHHYSELQAMFSHLITYTMRRNLIQLRLLNYFKNCNTRYVCKSSLQHHTQSSIPRSQQNVVSLVLRMTYWKSELQIRRVNKRIENKFGASNHALKIFVTHFVNLVCVILKLIHILILVINNGKITKMYCHTVILITKMIFRFTQYILGAESKHLHN